ncbi:MAG: hypothetical protein F4W92_09095 [Gammaproteobacteria bacterium]|nr:hypothetical protein [Gammaproteobacteria bacterium]
MRVPILLVLAVSLIASGCASMHDPVARGPETTSIDTTVTETVVESVDSSEAEATLGASTQPWAGAPNTSFLPKSMQSGIIVGLTVMGLWVLWAILSN